MSKKKKNPNTGGKSKTKSSKPEATAPTLPAELSMPVIGKAWLFYIGQWAVVLGLLSIAIHFLG